jgi:hypothetical protein
MTVTVRTDTPYRDKLPAGKVFSITAAAISNGRTGRLGDHSGERVPDVPTSFRPIAAGLTVRVGPFAIDTNHLVETFAGSLAVTVVDAVLPLPISGAPTDVVEFFGSGAPVDYTDGDPVATGQDTAGIGSRYTDIAAGTLYINTGTRGAPVWTQLAPVA